MASEEDFEPRVSLKMVNEAMEDNASEDELVAGEIELLNAIEYQLHRPTAEHHRNWLVEVVDQQLELEADKALPMDVDDLKPHSNDTSWHSLKDLLGTWHVAGALA